MPTPPGKRQSDRIDHIYRTKKPRRSDPKEQGQEGSGIQSEPDRSAVAGTSGINCGETFRKKVMEALSGDVSQLVSKWRELGLYLEIDCAKLDQIGDTQDKLGKVIEAWGEQQQHSQWEAFAIALDNLKERKIADKFRSEIFAGVSKRKVHLKWDDYFMAVALLSQGPSQAGECARESGVCIVNEESKTVATSYSEQRVCHAAINTILMGRSSTDLRGGVMYTTHFPCNECAQYIIQSGIQKVIYGAQQGAVSGAKEKEDIAKKLMDHAHIYYKSYNAWKSDAKKTVARINLSASEPSVIMDYKELVADQTGGGLEPDEYFMAVAFLASLRSKDPHRQVGACIVKKELRDDKKSGSRSESGSDQKKSMGRIVGTGYNGLPHGCSDDDFPWQKHEDLRESEKKKHYICHAEMNVIMHRTCGDLRGTTLYTTLSPCERCTHLIEQAGIEEVVYAEKYKKFDCEEYLEQQAKKGCSLTIARRMKCKKGEIEINLSEGTVNDD